MDRILSELDALDPQPRGHEFERVTKWLLQNAPRYRTQSLKVYLWSDYPEAWGPDTGIDLICEGADGRLWAVQSKAYSEGSTVSWRDLATFVGASAARPEVGYLLIVTTGAGLSRNAVRNLDACGKPWGLVERDTLLRLDLPPNVGLADLRAPKIERFKPLLHQREAINAVVRGFKSHDRGQLIMACGTGKTLAALWTHERLKSERTLVFVPSLALVRQTLREWSRHATRSFTAVVVCSDASVIEDDEMVTSVSSIGLPATTDHTELRRALRANGRTVVFATYQSSKVIEDALKGTGL